MPKFNAAAQLGAPYNINDVNKLLIKAGKPILTVQQFKRMTPAQVQSYIKTYKDMSGGNFRDNVKTLGKEFRKSSKQAMHENFRQAELMHGTIRQGLVELGGLGAQAIGTRSISRISGIGDAIKQNIDGGTEDPRSFDDEDYTEKGPVNKAFKSRKED